MRDRAAKERRRVVLDIHNHHNDLDTSAKLLQLAIKIAGTEGLKALLKMDLELQKNISYEQDNTLAIEIPGTFAGGTMTFKPDQVTYGGRKIYYKDATTVLYHAMRRSVNTVPIPTYSFMVGSADQTISVSWGTTLYIGNEKKQDVWQRLAGIASHVIEPQIVEKMVRRIFVDGGTVHIGDLEFTREGYRDPGCSGGGNTFPGPILSMSRNWAREM